MTKREDTYPCTVIFDLKILFIYSFLPAANPSGPRTVGAVVVVGGVVGGGAVCQGITLPSMHGHVTNY